MSEKALIEKCRKLLEREGGEVREFINIDFPRLLIRYNRSSDHKLSDNYVLVYWKPNDVTRYEVVCGFLYSSTQLISMIPEMINDAFNYLTQQTVLDDLAHA